MKRAVSVLSNEEAELICHSIRSTRLISGTLLFIALIVLVVMSLITGAYNLGVSDVFNIISGAESDSILNHVFFNIRLPRVLAAIATGACLGAAGLVMQSVLENPLASPFTTGVSQGAMFGATFAIIFLGAATMNATGTEVMVNSIYITSISAFAGSLITVAIIIMMASVINIKSESIILAGIAISSFFAALTMFMQYFASDTEVAASVIWTFGDLAKVGYQEIIIIFAVFLPASIYFYINSWSYTCLLWGDEVARGLGIRTTYFRMISLIVASVIVAVPVSFVGIIGFIGLMAPHMVKLFVSGDHRYLLPYSAVTGAVLLLLADIISRVIIPNSEIPVGIMTSIIGVPFFLYLLLKKHGRRGI
ncbi:MAG: iron ABC transporter permease [Denitrovibrio sp.]|nr:MAG: iron ABC transporter permease [Denitrovibrio sp.]